ncbi:MAG: hypothetical protein U5R46_18110 [Gammaproteobacteria bacterium]|nr:hypothetical protein [Gammaproteobacteria bacterium]
MILISRSIAKRLVLLAGILGMSIAGATGIVSAQSTDGQAAPSSEAPAAMQELQTKQQQIQQLMNELRGIQQAATEANPELAEAQREYRDLVVATMSEQNFDPQAAMEDLQALQAELQGGGEQLGEEERRAKMQELEQKSQEFRSQQQQAMQDEEVMAARDELDQRMRTAMKEEDPEAAEMMAELTALQKEYRSLLQEAMQQQQQGNEG